MARSKKQARHITVNDVAYSWRARGDDGCISITIWPSTMDGPSICATFSYHETWIPRGLSDVFSSAGDQIVITNRIVRRVIVRAIEQFAYNPTQKGELIRIPKIDRQIDIGDAIRA